MLMLQLHFRLQGSESDGAVVQALGSRRQVILDNIRDNDEADVNYQRVYFHLLLICSAPIFF